MRLNALELLRYGRFSDRRLHFPQAACDFHLVVGPNEAGKSTLRRAVSELLFGMPQRSDMDFMHPISELRLGAVIESPAGTLAFHRARGRRSLRRPDDQPLADTVLAEHLGGTGEALFKRMFCLDLAGLLDGGKSILEASDDVGQLLFQSAAGLAGLGAVRDALAEEAGKLYAPRRSGERAFYQALDRHESARQALRAMTVSSRQWADAVGKVDALQAQRRQAAERYHALSAQRQTLERVRRIAPRVAQWRELQAQWQDLAAAVVMPDDAGRRLDEAEVALALETVRQSLHESTGARLDAQLAALALDQPVLAQATAVQALSAQAHGCAQHRQKIAGAEQALQALLHDAAVRATQLGWPPEENALRMQLPAPLALKTLAALLEQRGALLQAQQSAESGHGRARAALERLRPAAAAPGQPATLPGTAPETPDAAADAAQPWARLATALHAAQPWQASAARQRTQLVQRAQAEAQWQAAHAALGAWRMDAPALAALSLPSEEQLAARKAERAELAASLGAARQQQAQADEQARQSGLALVQFTASRSVVTLDQVHAARAQRDTQWQRIKREEVPLAAGAAPLEQAIADADRLVDNQRDQAADAARLLSLRQDAARDAEAAQARARQHQSAAQALQVFDVHWAEHAARLGLAGMPLLDLSAWQAQRRAALDATATLQSRTLELQSEQTAEAMAHAELLVALRGSGDPAPADSPLAQLCARAEQRLAERQAALAWAESLARQRSEAEAELAHQALSLNGCSRAVNQWQERWQSALAAARLPDAWMSPEAARAAIEVAREVLNLLGQVDDLRRHRLLVPRQELAGLDASAQTLRAALGLPGTEQDGDSGDAFALANALALRLQLARETQQAHARLSAERQASAAEARSADAALAAARAALAPLYALAGSEEHGRVRDCIAESDRRRVLQAAAQQHRQSILEQGDGLRLDALLAECDGVALDALKPRIDDLETQLADSFDQQQQLGTALAQAESDLARVQGGADAATAESMRLEALAQLGDAAERYATVAAGHRLLRWAIDRYRERKQGPLLQRAGELFAQLTLGGFARLVADVEHQAPRLVALRTTGERVDIEGLSEGTRDQLFLALRLAALEMQIANDRPLPFIADDLFVNFHDSRSRAGLAALGALARRTQVIFLTHHEHLVPVARECIGVDIHVTELG